MLPNINQVVDNVSGIGVLSFGDAFTRYNQLKIHPDDEDKIAFITNERVYSYKVMPFELKNVGATYQRMMNKVFVELIERNKEVYLDDILVKSKDPQQHWHNLEETFKTL